MLMEHFTIKPEDLPSEPEEIKISAEELEPIIIETKDFLRAEVEQQKDPNYINLTKPENILGTDYDSRILTNLRAEVKTNREQGLNGGQIYRKLAIAYHPDSYRSEAPEVQALAHEYFKALQALKGSNELD
jgi:hypothetical protein